MNDTISNDGVKILVYIYGILGRSFHYTCNSIQKNIIDRLQQRYDVDICILNWILPSPEIDGVNINTDIKFIEQYFRNSRYNEFKQYDFDILFSTYKNELNDVFYYNEKDRINGFRQLYLEYQVGLSIENNSTKYDKIVVVHSDFYIINPLQIIELHSLDNSTLLIPPMNDAGGYTNGFYIGHPTSVIPILKRYTTIVSYKLCLKKDYEFYIQWMMKCLYIKRKICSTLFFKIRANKTIFWAEWSAHIHQQIIPNIKEIYHQLYLSLYM